MNHSTDSKEKWRRCRCAKSTCQICSTLQYNRHYGHHRCSCSSKLSSKYCSDGLDRTTGRGCSNEEAARDNQLSCIPLKKRGIQSFSPPADRSIRQQRLCCTTPRFNRPIQCGAIPVIAAHKQALAKFNRPQKVRWRTLGWLSKGNAVRPKVTPRPHLTGTKPFGQLRKYLKPGTEYHSQTKSANRQAPSGQFSLVPPQRAWLALESNRPMQQANRYFAEESFTLLLRSESDNSSYVPTVDTDTKAWPAGA